MKFMLFGNKVVDLDSGDWEFVNNPQAHCYTRAIKRAATRDQERGTEPRVPKLEPELQSRGSTMSKSETESEPGELVGTFEGICFVVVADGQSYVYRVRNDADLDLGADLARMQGGTQRVIGGNANTAGDAARQRRRINQRSYDAIADINKRNEQFWKERMGR